METHKGGQKQSRPGTLSLGLVEHEREEAVVSFPAPRYPYHNSLHQVGKRHCNWKIELVLLCLSMELPNGKLKLKHEGAAIGLSHASGLKVYPR